MIKCNYIKEKRYINSLFIYFLSIIFLQTLSLGSGNNVLKMFILSGFTVFLLLQHHIYHFKFEFKIISIIIFFCINNMIAFFHSSTLVSIPFTAYISVAVISTITIILLNIYAKLIVDINNILLFPRYYILLISSSCLYSIITEYNNILSIFSGVSAYSVDISSFFENKNTFGVFLFCGIIANTYLNIFQRKKMYNYLNIIFLIFLLLIGSKTALISSLVFLVLYWMFREGKKRAFYLRFIASLSILMTVYNNLFISNHLNTNSVYFESYLARDNLAKAVLNIVDNWSFIFGYGEDVTNIIMKSQGINPYFHNSFLSIFVTGGIVKVLIYILLFIWSLKKYTTLKKYNRQVYLVANFSLISYFIYSFGEAFVLFDTTAISFLLSVYVIIIPILILNYYKNKEEETYE